MQWQSGQSTQRYFSPCTSLKSFLPILSCLCRTLSPLSHASHEEWDLRDQSPLSFSPVCLPYFTAHGFSALLEVFRVSIQIANNSKQRAMKKATIKGLVSKCLVCMCIQIARILSICGACMRAMYICVAHMYIYLKNSAIQLTSVGVGLAHTRPNYTALQKLPGMLNLVTVNAPLLQLVDSLSLTDVNLPDYNSRY